MLAGLPKLPVAKKPRQFPKQTSTTFFLDPNFAADVSQNDEIVFHRQQSSTRKLGKKIPVVADRFTITTYGKNFFLKAVTASFSRGLLGTLGKLARI